MERLDTITHRLLRDLRDRMDEGKGVGAVEAPTQAARVKGGGAPAQAMSDRLSPRTTVRRSRSPQVSGRSLE